MASNMSDVTEKMRVSKISSGDNENFLNYFPFKMVKDKKTEMYIKFAKVLVVNQGPYTDIREKTSEMIKTKFKYTSCVVSDKRFRDDTQTLCSYEHAEEFYEYFKNASKRGLENSDNLLVIDSTMSNLQQNRYYVALAYKMQYVVLVYPPVVTKTTGYSWPKGSLAASFRDEGKTVILPTNMFQHLFCAWYLHDSDSSALRHDVSLYIQDCLEAITEFRQVVDRNISKINSDGEELSLIDAIRQYYNLTDQRQDLAFCAVKIIGTSLKLMNEYFKKQSVHDTYGKMSKLYIAGYVISPYIIAARVKLTFAQKDLWEIEDNMDETDIKNSNEMPIGPWKLLNESKKELPDVDVQLISSKCNPTLINTYQAINDPLKVISPFSKGRTCHIVLGKAAGADSHHVDFGVQYALNKERSFEKANADLAVYELKTCVVKRVGKYWFIYLRETMSVDALFASCVKPFPFDLAIQC